MPRGTSLRGWSQVSAGAPPSCTSEACSARGSARLLSHGVRLSGSGRAAACNARRKVPRSACCRSGRSALSW
ncbi:hypothetical protein P4123_01230 [Pseudomonas aeruginosa]|nr:hypothetical protein [Pseudomonas aeruginosa]